MRAAQQVGYGGAEAIQVNDVDEPHAGAGQIRVAVHAAAVNPIDGKYRSGMVKQKSLPFTVGFDIAGTVDEVGDGVEGVGVGDAVFGFSDTGALAENALSSDWQRKPDSMSWSDAAGAAMASETAARGLDLLDVGDGMTVLVNGASGGVGSAAVQLAVARGARVIGVAGERNADYLRELGAEPVTYGDGLVTRVREIAPAGVDKAFDVAGSHVLPELVELTGSKDAVVTIADFGGAKELGVRATSGSAGRSMNGLRDAAELSQRGKFRVEIQQEYPLEKAGEATVLLDEGHVRGKLIVTP